MHRRAFLSAAASAVGLALLGNWEAAAAAPARRDRMLVVLHLFGGNDGLNTVVPQDGAYRRARPTLAIQDARPAGHGLGFHPALAPLMPLWDRGRMAVVNGTGYTDPNRSHFRSTEIWQTAEPHGVPDAGWLGRYLDLTGSAGVNVDATLARALWSHRSSPLSVHDPAAFRLVNPPLASAIDQLYRAPDQPPHLRRTWSRLQEASKALHNETVGRAMPATDIGRALRTVLQLMPLGRVYHVTMSGFDTHTGQIERQARALGELTTALSAFMQHLEASGVAERTLVMVYSEFGRRVEENASGGTDHGTAGPLFLLGPVRGGFHGDHPSLTALDDGDLRHTVDFREIYAGVLEDWLGADSAAVLGARFTPQRLVAG